MGLLPKRVSVFLATIVFCGLCLQPAFAQGSYTVQPGDSIWKIAVRYEVGISDILELNPQVKDPNLIYPGQVIAIPDYNAIKIVENKVIDLVNEVRQKNGLRPVLPNWELSRCARHKSQDMRDRNYFSHTSPTYGSPFTMIKNYGINYTAAGENIAAGQQTPEKVMQDWMNSEGHRQNILNPSFTHLGVGYTTGGSYRYYWTQMFVRK